METSNPVYPEADQARSASNRILIKGLITAALILLLMIPTVFISNLVSERASRQREVSKEVSSKWANAQTLSGPFLYLPYTARTTSREGRAQDQENALWILPENLALTGQVAPQVRTRSIYKVLLYRASLQSRGNFIFSLPKSIDTASIAFADARICFRISDAKGIEKKVTISFNGSEYELSPGLPGAAAKASGLSAPVVLNRELLGGNLGFSMKLQLKGSEQLHFMPLSGNSEFSLQSSWPNPSFDGSNLPDERTVTDSGFTARWVFNKANLPFGTLLEDPILDEDALSFGVSILEPADQYAKTSRCVKYAILFIGLTFSLFFIVELTQHKPVHPVQYILIGLALVILYSLLLSFSEFILFDAAYIIAAVSTISLITLYAYQHFRKLSSAAIFGGVLINLYAFIFILIRLEDTALLVGSIGLFLVLALVMFASRKVNWYGQPQTVVKVTEKH